MWFCTCKYVVDVPSCFVLGIIVGRLLHWQAGEIVGYVTFARLVLDVEVELRKAKSPLLYPSWRSRGGIVEDELDCSIICYQPLAADYLLSVIRIHIAMIDEVFITTFLTFISFDSIWHLSPEYLSKHLHFDSYPSS